MMHRLLPLLLLFFVGCYRVSDKIEPQLNYAVQERTIKDLPSAFLPLSSEERDTAWGQEYVIGIKFAKELDLYRAVTSLKRAEFLIPANKKERLEEIQYLIMLSYYFGKRYQEVIDTFKASKLTHVTSGFPAYHDLLVILYESYLEIGDKDQADNIAILIQRTYPETAAKLKLATAIFEGDLPVMREESERSPEKAHLVHMLDSYEVEKKSVSKAQQLNAFLPGAGYYYVGQKQSAFTAFSLNALFIAAAYRFFHKGHIAAGMITTSFEAGWYFGGIYGAGEAAKLYNERLFERKAYPLLQKEKLFPVLTIEYGF